LVPAIAKKRGGQGVQDGGGQPTPVFQGRGRGDLLPVRSRSSTANWTVGKVKKGLKRKKEKRTFLSKKREKGNGYSEKNRRKTGSNKGGKKKALGPEGRKQKNPENYIKEKPIKEARNFNPRWKGGVGDL